MKASTMGFLLGGWMLFAAGHAWGEPPPPDATAGVAQQAPDFSAAVPAELDGFVTDEQSAKLFNDYIARMVEQGTPELAYDQAKTLLIFDSGNALAWGVVAFGDASRGDMVGAVSAIELAALLLPDNAFVQQIAGDLFAWYDVRGRELPLDDYTIQSLADARAAIGTRAGFAKAYGVGRKVYESQGESSLAPAASQ